MIIAKKKAWGIAEQLEINNFKAFNGWLEKWKARYNIRKVVVSREMNSGFMEGMSS